MRTFTKNLRIHTTQKSDLRQHKSVRKTVKKHAAMRVIFMSEPLTTYKLPGISPRYGSKTAGAGGKTTNKNEAHKEKRWN